MYNFKELNAETTMGVVCIIKEASHSIIMHCDVTVCTLKNSITHCDVTMDVPSKVLTHYDVIMILGT